jgi:hypothetical protein
MFRAHTHTHTHTHTHIYMMLIMWSFLVQEPDTDCLNSMLEAVEDIVNLLGPQLLSLDQVHLVFERLSGVLDDSATRRAERLKRQHAEDFDEEEAEALQVSVITELLQLMLI